MWYTIYYPMPDNMHNVNPINHACKRGFYEYEQIACVQANSLDGVWSKCQNHNDDYAYMERRSMCVGDIIFDIQNNTHYMVADLGFREIPPTVTQYIDWGNHLG